MLLQIVKETKYNDTPNKPKKPKEKKKETTLTHNPNMMLNIIGQNPTNYILGFSFIDLRYIP